MATAKKTTKLNLSSKQQFLKSKTSNLFGNLKQYKPKSYTPVLATLLVIAAFLLGILITKVQYLEKGGSPTIVQNAQVGATDNTAPAAGQKVDVEVGHLPVLGDKNAKVTVIEFSDFQCPFCQAYFNDAEKGIIKDYVDTGKIKFAYRHLPLVQIHPNAFKAASASECANEQGKFWGYHDLLFQNQNAWSNLDNAGAVNKFKEYAGTLGLNTTSFSSCLDSDKYKADIDKDIADSATAGVNGTPGTFVNGILISGAVPYADFKTQIDAALSE